MIKNLKKIRNENGISQQQLADVIMVSQQSVNKYENHGVEPDIETLIKIADYFNITIDYLVGRNEAAETAVSDISFKERELIKKIRNLKPQQRECVLKVVESYEK